MFWTREAKVLLILTTLLSLPALPAQSSQLPTENTRSKNRAAHFQQFQAEMFTSAPALPNLPEISGCKLLRGSAFRKVQGGPCYSMRFVCDYPSNEVSAWYKNILSSKPWTLNPGNQENCLSAKDTSMHICQIAILGSLRRGKKSANSIHGNIHIDELMKLKLCECNC